MPCYHPVRAWRGSARNPSGKQSIVFHPRQADDHTRPIDLPCGRCIGCRLEHSRQWAIRCVHEAQLHDQNCFLTLTYSDDKLPCDASLDVRHFQLFIKKLRKRYPEKDIRYFHCGEYGEETNRPHYHAILFGFDFEDKKRHKNYNGHWTWTSEELERLWGLGFCIIGTCSFASAAYVARYITKKVTGDLAEEHYAGRKPEYITMSRRPAIGKRWLDRFSDDIVKGDFCVVNGKKVGLPKYYDSQLDDDVLKALKKDRSFKAYDYKDNTTLRRLTVREKVTEARVQFLKRSFEND